MLRLPLQLQVSEAETVAAIGRALSTATTAELASLKDVAAVKQDGVVGAEGGLRRVVLVVAPSPPAAAQLLAACSTAVAAGQLPQAQVGSIALTPPTGLNAADQLLALLKNLGLEVYPHAS